jgi:hypothetical protein
MAQTDHPRIRLHAAEVQEEVGPRGETGHVKTNPERHSKAPSLYRLAFDDVVSDLLKVKPAATSERAAQKAEARLKTVRKGSRRKG